MTNLATLKSMQQAIWQAEKEYREAIKNNLKEIGKAVRLVPDVDDEDGYPEGLKLNFSDDDNYPTEAVFDKIKYGATEDGQGTLLLHVCYYDTEKCNEWWDIGNFCEQDGDYIRDNIAWPNKYRKGEADTTNTEQARDMMVLCSVDEENTKDMPLCINQSDLDNPEVIEDIAHTMREIYCVDDYVATVGDEGEQEFQEAIDNLANGRNAHFECYDWFWERVAIIK